MPDDLLKRVEALERQAAEAIDVGDLPLAGLQRKLEATWVPDGARLLQGRSVTSDQLGTGALVSGEARLRIVRGSVTAAAVLSLGAGFTSVYNGVGDYTITFAVPFQATPVILLTAGITVGPFVAKLHQTTPPSATVFRISAFNSSTAAAADTIVNFIAIGLD